MLLLLLLLAVPLAITKGCSGDPEAEHLRRQLELSQERYDAARRELETERARTQAAADDLYVAAAVCFASVLAVFLLLLLVLREHRSKRALVGLLQWLRKRSRNGK